MEGHEVCLSPSLSHSLSLEWAAMKEVEESSYGGEVANSEMVAVSTRRQVKEMAGMEQLRQVGEALGGLKALMVFQGEIQINQRQCCLLADAFTLAFDVIVDQMKQHLRFDEKQTKWHALENPLKELHRILKEGESFVRHCLEHKDFWAKAISLCQNPDAVEFHLHNLLSCLPVVLEAIENVGEISGRDHETLQKKRIVFSKKYEREWMDPKLFNHQFGRIYLVSQEFCSRFSSTVKEDRWILAETISEKKQSTLMPLTKHENQLADLLLAPRGKLHPSSVLMGSKDFLVKRRLDGGGQYKEVHWMGESFALRHVFCDVNSMAAEISLLTSISHPNVLSYNFVFSDDDRKECFVLMELMNKDLCSHIREISSARRRVPFPLLVAVDIMLQIARGMEFLHSRKIYHGDLNPSNILLRSRNASSDGYLHVKITGFGQSSAKNNTKHLNSPRFAEKSANPCIWCAPEALTANSAAKFTEKGDVYSFAMICFELLTGKIPFEDDHLQGEKMSRSIRAGERPLFPSSSPKYLTSLTKKCWNRDPTLRPSFSSICRILRYIKRFLIMYPDHSQPDLPSPAVDYLDLEMSLLKRFKEWPMASTDHQEIRVCEIPFQMYCYRVLERERTSVKLRDQIQRSSDSGSDEASGCGDDISLQEEAFPNTTLQRSQSHPDIHSKKPAAKVEAKPGKPFGQQHTGRTLRPPQLALHRLSVRIQSETHLQPMIMSPLVGRRRSTGHASDSELT
ncbi:Light-sensor Protein kinase [Apostasia shenzhenica]|uniref:Light-sensor Protein kinase n=1 Tax=Apostasia shenzhenica TaxID=1088818 RepID=A0A2I0AE19_9ASPA|nr:Light-sensor Protein kinase [Apostasia shenzhenica]